MSDTERSESITRRRFLGAAGAAGVTAVAGCSSDEDPIEENGNGIGDDDTDIDDDERILRLTTDSVSSLDPVVIQLDAVGEYQLYNGLTDHVDGELPAVGQLADDYEISEDDTTYTFHLKEGVQFHDGRELTADDVVFSFRRVAESPETRNADDIVGDTMEIAHETDDDGEIVPDSLAVEAVDEYTVEIELAQPFHATLEQLANNSFSIIPEGVVGDIEGFDGEMDQSEFATDNPIGTGPFQYEEWEDGSHVRLSTFEEYHGDVPEIDGVHWQILPGSDARFRRAMNENLDAFTLEPARFDPDLLEVEETDDTGREFGRYGPMENDRTVNYESAPTLVTHYLVFNTERTDERAARRAIALIIDQSRLVEQEFKELHEPAYHITPPQTFPGGPEAYWEHAENNYPWGFNEERLNEARELMEEAGYDEDNRYEMSLTTFEDTSWEEFGELLASQARSAHIDLSVEQAPFSTIINRAIEGTMDVFTLWDRMDFASPEIFLRFLHPGTASTFTRWGQFEGSETEWTQQAADGWEQFTENRGPTEAEADARGDGFVDIEEANWHGIAQLPIMHERSMRLSYDWVDMPMHGPMQYQMYNTVTIDDRE